MKKFLCTILIIVILCTLFVGCSPTDKTYKNAPPKDNAVAVITLYTFNGDSERVPGLMNLGHAFITISNISNTALTIGSFTLDPNSEVSVGAWGIDAHWGIWYNVESTYMSIGRYDGRISVSQQIDANDIDVLNDYIAKNDTWTPFKNCSASALTMWNIVSHTDAFIDLTGLITPARIYSLIIANDGYEVNRIMPNFGMVGYGKAPDNNKKNPNKEFKQFYLREDKK